MSKGRKRKKTPSSRAKSTTTIIASGQEVTASVKHRESAVDSDRKSNKPHRPRRKMDLGRLSRRLFIGLGVLTLSTAGLAAYKQKHEQLHDLSVIGQGVPTVVQIHDPGCPKCQQLKSNVQQVMGEFENRLHYRVANIRTAAGRALQHKHRVPHVTLLLFDGDGNLKRTTSGIIAPETLVHAFRAHLEGR